MGLPISVARPMASFTASRPAMGRMYMSSAPRRAQEMVTMTMVEYISIITRTLVRLALYQSPTGRTGPMV